VGMRVGVAFSGAGLCAGPGQGGGYTLSARLPLDGARAA